MLPVVDDSEFPIVRIVFGKDLTVADVEQHHSNFTTLFEARGPFLSIAEADQMSFTSQAAPARKLLAECADHLGERGAFIAEFMVVNSAVVRALFTAYTWLRAKKTHPVQCYANLAEAQAEARRILAQRGAK